MARFIVTAEVGSENRALMFNVEHLKQARPLMTVPGGGTEIMLTGEISPLRVILPFPILLATIGDKVPDAFCQQLVRLAHDEASGEWVGTICTPREHVVMTPRQVRPGAGNDSPLQGSQ